MDKICPKSTIIFFTQIITALLVVVAAIINLSLETKDKEMWISLLCTCIGYVLPSPTLKKVKDFSTSDQYSVTQDS